MISDSEKEKPRTESGAFQTTLYRNAMNRDQTEQNVTEIVSQSPTLSNSEFLQAVFGDRWQNAYVTGFTQDPAELDSLGLRHFWGGWPWNARPIEEPHSNNFFTISTFKEDPTTRKVHRRKADFEAGYCVMIDDVGGGLGSKISVVDMLSFGVPPSWIIETSPDNYQYGYIFDNPVLEPNRVDALINGLVDAGLVDDGADPGMKGVTRYARLPVGSNTKAKYGGHFPHRVVQWHPERKYSPDEIARSFGFELVTYDREENFGEAKPPEEDLIYQSLDRLGLVKGVNRPGIYEIQCPWLHEHTDGMDNGAAYLAPMGFKCHHGHCAGRTGKDLINYLHGADRVYVESVAEALPFTPHATISEKQGGSEGSEIVALRATKLPELEAAIAAVQPVDKPSFERALRALALAWPDLDAWERDKYEYDIKQNAVTRIGVVRDAFKAMQKTVRLELRRAGMAREPVWVHMLNDKPIAVRENVQAMCEFYGIRLRYNQMSHKVEMDAPGIEYDEEQQDNLNLSYIKDRMQEHGMPYTRADELMLQIAMEAAYHPFTEYLDSLDLVVDPMLPAFNEVLSTLIVPEDENYSIEFVRRWFISNVAAARGHAGFGMKGVLTLSGPQSIGKTSWFRMLYPKGMFCEGLVLDPHNKDTLIKGTSFIACELGELDATFKRDIPALKAFISSHTDEIRHPYAAKFSKHPRRTAFCATVNESNFLIDQTGNSRFWPIEVAKCDLVKLQKLRDAGTLDMFWAEVDVMYRACVEGRNEFKWWIDMEEMYMLDSASEKFTQLTTGEEALVGAFNFGGPAVHWYTSKEIMDILGFAVTHGHYNVRRNEVLAAIRRLTGVGSRRSFRRDGQVLNGYMMPQRTLEKVPATLSVVPPTMPFESVTDDTFDINEWL